MADFLVDSMRKADKNLSDRDLSLKSDVLDHIQNFQPVLKDIKNLNVDLLDRITYDTMYKDNLKRISI